MNGVSPRIAAEVREWPEAVIVDLERGRKHQKLILRFGERERFVTLSSTVSDRRALDRQVGDVRRTLAGLGAVRNQRRKAKTHHIRNRPDRSPLRSIERAPVKPNPFEKLATIQFAEPRKSWFRRFLAWLAG